MRITVVASLLSLALVLHGCGGGSGSGGSGSGGSVASGASDKPAPKGENVSGSSSSNSSSNEDTPAKPAGGNEPTGGKEETPAKPAGGNTGGKEETPAKPAGGNESPGEVEEKCATLKLASPEEEKGCADLWRKSSPFHLCLEGTSEGACSAQPFTDKCKKQCSSSGSGDSGADGGGITGEVKECGTATKEQQQIDKCPKEWKDKATPFYVCLDGMAKKGCDNTKAFPLIDCKEQCRVTGSSGAGNAFTVLDDATRTPSDGTSSLPEKILYMLLGALIAAVVIIAYRATVGKYSKAREVSLKNEARPTVELSA